jgi:hypothetical protein
MGKLRVRWRAWRELRLLSKGFMKRRHVVVFNGSSDRAGAAAGMIVTKIKLMI